MTNKHKKFLLIGFCAFAFLCVGVSCLPADAAPPAQLQLEVAYPTIAGQTISTNTKLPDYVLYLFNAGMFLGFFAAFISLVIAGAMWILSPAKPDLLADAKDRITGAVSGLLILALTYLIITTINPQLGFLKFNALPATPEPPPIARTEGVYFYQEAGCPSGSNDALLPHASSTLDLGPLKNSVLSVEVVRGSNSYITVLYDTINLRGKCQYITNTDSNNNSYCQKVEPFAASASVHAYDFSPNGDGVYFYRKSCLSDPACKNDRNACSVAHLVSYCNENSGGYYEVKNSDISGIYIHKLDNPNGLEFAEVPEEEQNCTEYDDTGTCTGRSIPTLGGENISSMVIKGNYLVLLVYFGPNHTENGPWTFCQEFPTNSDANGLGPQQIKWEEIRANNNGVVPNYVIIMPIQK